MNMQDITSASSLRYKAVVSGFIHNVDSVIYGENGLVTIRVILENTSVSQLHIVDNRLVKLLRPIGLYDCNGVGVYEGDIIKSVNDDSNDYVIVWQNESASFWKSPVGDESSKVFLGLRNMYSWKVIGNIFAPDEKQAKLKWLGE